MAILPSVRRRSSERLLYGPTDPGICRGATLSLANDRPAPSIRAMRLPILAALLATPAAVFAQAGRLTSADSALIGRILVAEDRRDSTNVALAAGLEHQDARVRTIARRARWRIVDSTFAARDSLPPLAAPPSYSDPAWRLRFRGLTAKRNDCAALNIALGDSVWAVRLRAADLVPATCANDAAILATLRGWIDALPADASRRASGGVAWQGAAHAVVALARMRTDDARDRENKLASHKQWQLRVYAASASVLVGDTATLRTLARDPDDNVKEAAIDRLSKVAGHADDDIYLAALSSKGAQAVRAAAKALAGSTRMEVKPALNATFAKWVAKQNASFHDVRAALLESAGRPPTDDRLPPIHIELPPRAVALALGADIRLRVTMSAASGGGSFVVKLRGDAAPMMAARVLALARAGYYDGLTWHRVEPDFVIQGGSPGATEYIGSAQFFRDDLGGVPHVRGTVGMSTRGHDTGDGQWFVNLRDNLRLNGAYSAFGEVVQGIDAVDGILEGDTIASIAEVRGGGR
jgi:cyclophilin family peptidyl-prolyl cis-trans isomerase